MSSTKNRFWFDLSLLIMIFCYGPLFLHKSVKKVMLLRGKDNMYTTKNYQMFLSCKTEKVRNCSSKAKSS